MKLTLRRQQVRVPGGRIGQVLVPPWFTDPERGMVRCDAAPLLAVWLSKSLSGAGGRPAVGNDGSHGVELCAALGPAAAVAGDDGSPVSGIMSTVSWADRRGGVGGFALVTHCDDRVALEAAGEAMRQWAGLLRSRRLLLTDMPALCRGGRRAAQMIDAMTREAIRSDGGRVFVVGRPVADETRLVAWKLSGVVHVDDLDAVPDGAPVVFPAHGVSPSVRAEAARRSLRVVDGTCPLVTAVHADAAAYAARGDHVVVIGDRRHASLPILAACAGPAAEVVHSALDVRSSTTGAHGSEPGPVSFVIDPGMAVEDALPIVTALRDRVPRLAGHHFDVLCDAASDRAQTIASVSSGSELTLILAADEIDPDAQDALRMATAHPYPRGPAGFDEGRAGGSCAVDVVTCLADLKPERLAGVTAVGLVGTLSAPAGLREQVVAALAGLGPLTCRRRTVDTAPAPFKAGEPSDERLGDDASPAMGPPVRVTDRDPALITARCVVPDPPDTLV
ncbi:hypothetical protein [Thermomonospora umbrina]|uniref:4-hydroxy-3-methylbut-2-enyl diphosphate reductase n=1 Tax=Thermomonospora umbrina TaxID=111806 RepID=A0A3D9T0T1_9ACTN|nr:hypothetical protein [Thermomonospora umbrina]REF00421.1 4-hydroxy-3-methylbut-2-enyl diphosphate reductase [Thermomonospora umbrina]